MSLNKIHISLHYHDDKNFRSSLVNQKIPLIMGCTADLPNPINIQYADMMSLKRFLLSFEGQYLVRLASNSKYKVNFHPTDVYSTDDGLEILNEFYNILHETTNIKIWNTEYYCDKTNYSCGLDIYDAIYELVDKCRNTNFLDSNKEYHFLTLNNIEKPERIELHDFLENNPKIKESSLSSFLWMGKKLDELDIQKNSKGAKNEQQLYNWKTLKKYYDKCAIEIVCESGPNIISEKILKPLLMGTPFLIYTNHLSNLYSTFNHLGIDIDYFGIKYNSKEDFKTKNTKNVESIVNKIINTDISELKNKYKSDFQKANQNRTKILKIWDELPNFKNYQQTQI